MATILIVDDSQPNRLYLRTLLHPGGHRLLEAADGAQALELVRQEQPDLVISDILMPTMDGYQFARQLRSEPAVAGTPVIFFTATYHEPEAQALAQACGVLHLLSKPTDPDTILLAVNEALGLAPPTPAPPAPPASGEFDREHLQLLTNKLAEKVRELETVNSRLTAMYEQIQKHALRLEQEVIQRQQAEAAVRSLSRQLLAAQEAERRHIARELHDQVGQALTALKINLEGLQRIAGGGARNALVESIDIASQTLQQVRTLSLDLRPSMLDDLGLVAALRWYLDRQAQRAGFQAAVVAESLPQPLAAEIATACFRVAQEAVTNIVRHAGARHVQIELKPVQADLEMTIRDDGTGFDAPAARQRASRGGSLGLLGMQERVMLLSGQFEVESAAGRGTVIRVRLPLTPPALAAETGS
ncbi:MAG TPA: response regulator [Gemmataceae bacterium]|nr:response regulator [Gemmataceae bacterium]